MVVELFLYRYVNQLHLLPLHLHEVAERCTLVTQDTVMYAFARRTCLVYVALLIVFRNAANIKSSIMYSGRTSTELIPYCASNACA